MEFEELKSIKFAFCPKTVAVQFGTSPPLIISGIRTVCGASIA
jgi:hypothetical protein